MGAFCVKMRHKIAAFSCVPARLSVCKPLILCLLGASVWPHCIPLGVWGGGGAIFGGADWADWADRSRMRGRLAGFPPQWFSRCFSRGSRRRGFAALPIPIVRRWKVILRNVRRRCVPGIPDPEGGTWDTRYPANRRRYHLRTDRT
jgi:hypothetical protein